ncbi:MAG: hypothetical protein ACE5LU_22260 [Anaerolineae bacterium]
MNCPPATKNLLKQINQDALLQASRRVDWRFLLPEPNLGQVAYIGPAAGTLLESLRLFSTSLIIIEPSREHVKDAAQHDVVIAKAPTLEALRQAARLVRSGGFLYVEAYGLFGPGWLRPPVHYQSLLKRPLLPFPVHYMTVAERLGFHGGQVYWHWPDFESCSKIVPLDSSAAVRYAFAQGQDTATGRLKATLGHWLLRSGLLPQMVPCFSIVAQRGLE